MAGPRRFRSRRHAARALPVPQSSVLFFYWQPSASRNDPVREKFSCDVAANGYGDPDEPTGPVRGTTDHLTSYFERVYFLYDALPCEVQREYWSGEAYDNDRDHVSNDRWFSNDRRLARASRREEKPQVVGSSPR